MNNANIQLPDVDVTITLGMTVKIGRFSHDKWIVCYGWYSCNGNRSVCGWYLTGVITKMVKPLQYCDVEDIYIIEGGD